MLHHLLKNRSQTTEKHSFLNFALKTPSYTNPSPPAQKMFQTTEKHSFLNTVFEDTKLYESSTTCSKNCFRPPQSTYF